MFSLYPPFERFFVFVNLKLLLFISSGSCFSDNLSGFILEILTPVILKTIIILAGFCFSLRQ